MVSTLLKNVISLTNFNAHFFIQKQYVRYIIILDMFRALTCSPSGGKIVFTQHLVSSLSVQYSTVHRLRADCSPLSTCVLCRRLQRAKIPDAVLNTIFPPEDGHVNARNISRIIM
jgi:hypothetical protein